MGETSIQWTNATWNPVRGCTIVSPGCTHCYAMRMAHRFSGPGKPFEGLTRLREHGGPVWTGDVRLADHMLDLPKRWASPRRVFVSSMSALFHEGLADDDVAKVFDVIASTPRHTFQILTKRADRMRAWCTAYVRRAPLPSNVWLGVSVEDQLNAALRVPDLLEIPASIRFVSYEPALERVDFAPFVARGLDWIIVGGESGAGARPFDLAFVRATIAQCERGRTAVFFKQTGSVLARALGLRDAKGGDFDDPALPDDVKCDGFRSRSTARERGARSRLVVEGAARRAQGAALSSAGARRQEHRRGRVRRRSPRLHLSPRGATHRADGVATEIDEARVNHALDSPPHTSIPKRESGPRTSAITDSRASSAYALASIQPSSRTCSSRNPSVVTPSSTRLRVRSQIGS